MALHRTSVSAITRSAALNIVHKPQSCRASFQTRPVKPSATGWAACCESKTAKKADCTPSSQPIGQVSRDVNSENQADASGETDRFDETETRGRRERVSKSSLPMQFMSLMLPVCLARSPGRLLARPLQDPAACLVPVIVMQLLRATSTPRHPLKAPTKHAMHR